MDYLREDYGSYRLHLIKTEKFKLTTVRVSFRREIKKDEITIRNVLADVFTQSSANYNSKKALTIKAQDLYAADIATATKRIGNYINTDISLSVLNDKYTEKGNFKSAVEFLSEIIFKPDVKDGAFNEEKLDIVKNLCKSALDSVKEDTAAYSTIRLAEEFDKKSPLSYRMIGYQSDLEKVNTKNLYEYYLSMIKSDLVDIFVIGNIDFEEIKTIIKNNFKIRTFKKPKGPYLLEDKKARLRKKIVKETIDGTQSKLGIACRCHGLSDYEKNYPMLLFNAIYGGTVDSKLFTDVREKNSLCYTIWSVPNKLDQTLYIKAGIDKKNYQKSVSLIEKNLQLMKKGDFSDLDIKKAKEYYNTALDETLESENSIINEYFMHEVVGTDLLEEKRAKMAKVTKKEIVAVARKIDIDTIFLLEGVVNEGN